METSHKIITRNNVKRPNLTDLFGKAGRKFLNDVELIRED
jgi:hypothetical protein